MILSTVVFEFFLIQVLKRRNNAVNLFVDDFTTANTLAVIGSFKLESLNRSMVSGKLVKLIKIEFHVFWKAVKFDFVRI